MDDLSIKEAAMYFRSEIMSMMSEQDELPRPINLEAVMSGQGEPPESILQFFRTLYTGSNVTSSKKTERLVRSASDDAVFVTTRGRTNHKNTFVWD